jgi:hypothetical protein
MSRNYKRPLIKVSHSTVLFQRLLIAVNHNFWHDVVNTERSQLEAIKRIPRRPSIPGHTSELRLQVLEGRGFNSKYKNLYATVEFNGIKERTKTASRSHSDPVWQHPCLFNATKVDERADVKITVLNDGTFSDEIVGRVNISLQELNLHTAVEKWFILKDPKTADELGSKY